MEWISIKDRLPENGQIVVVYQEVGKWESACAIELCIYDDDKFNGYWVDSIRDPKYWLALPKLPDNNS
jgi:hypothetical protein